MDEQRFNEWINRILETEEEEISCSDCFDLISSFVDHEETGKPMDPLAVGVIVHLRQCQACRDEYEMLREIVGLEAARQLPTINKLFNLVLPDSLN